MHCRRFIDKRRGLYNAVGLKLYFDATARYNKNVRININLKKGGGEVMVFFLKQYSDSQCC